jgi:hypothetical protein
MEVVRRAVEVAEGEDVGAEIDAVVADGRISWAAAFSDVWSPEVMTTPSCTPPSTSWSWAETTSRWSPWRG